MTNVFLDEKEIRDHHVSMTDPRRIGADKKKESLYDREDCPRMVLGQKSDEERDSPPQYLSHETNAIREDDAVPEGDVFSFPMGGREDASSRKEMVFERDA